MSRLGINIGSGSNFYPDTDDISWINVDADPNVRANCRLPIDELSKTYAGKADIIHANDILEHVPYNLLSNPDQWRETLKDWIRCLATRGSIRVQVPNPKALLDLWQSGEITEVQMIRGIYGENTGPLDRHYQMFSVDRLAKEMQDLGLDIREAYILYSCTVVIGVKV